MKRKLTKILLTVTALITLSLVLSFSSSAKKVTTDGFTFNVGTKSAVLLSYNGKAKTVKIPAKVNGVPVTAIEKEAFWQNKTMTGISIPSTVTEIGSAAFNECTALTRVNFPKNLKTLGESAFWYCTNLKQVFLYKNVSKIGENAFRGCDKATVYVEKGSYAEKYVKKTENVKLSYRYATSIKLNKASLTLTIGDTSKLTSSLSPSKLYNKNLTFKSSDENVVAVSSKGELKALTSGYAVITCTTKDGSKLSASCKITVAPKKVTGLKVTNVTNSSYRLAWNKSEGASAYRINRYNETTKKWETISRTSKNYLNIKGLEIGSSIRYVVRSYATVDKKYIYSTANTYITAKTYIPDKITKLKGVAGSSSITLSWPVVDGADGYTVYVYDKTANEYFKKTDVGSPKCTVDALESGTEYSFAVKAFFETSTGTKYSEYYSNICTLSTLPAKVGGFSIIGSTLTYDSVALSWTGNDSVSGYIVYMKEGSSKKYVPYKVIDDNNITSLEISKLTPETKYSFKIRAYIGAETNLSEDSNILTVTTKEKVINDDTAFDFFKLAFNETKNSQKGFTVIKQCSIINRVAPDMVNYINVLSSIATASNKTYTVAGGKDINSGEKLFDIMAPSGAECTLDESQIDKKSLKYEENGSGYTVKFTLLPEEKEGSANSLITNLVDWNKVARENEGFDLYSCTYEGTTVEGKIQNGVFDHLIIKMPIKVTFGLNGTNYEFTQTIQTKYFFVR